MLLPLSCHRLRFYDESASPITSVLASWAGLLFYSGDRPPPGLVPLPWRCIMGEWPAS